MMSTVQAGGRKAQSLERLHIPSHWVEVQLLRIHYKCLGEGQPVILLHGSANDWHEWQENVSYLARQFRVYALDMPGFGLSQPLGSPLSLPWAVSFLAGFMDVLGISRAHLVGHSLGGMVVLSFALRFPERVRKLALVDCAGLGEMNGKAKVSLYVVRGARKLITGARIPRIARTPRGDRFFLNRLPGLRPRTIIMWGQHDRYLPACQAELAHLMIPNSELHIFPDCGHAPQRQRPDEFNRLLSQFFINPDRQRESPFVLSRPG